MRRLVKANIALFLGFCLNCSLAAAPKDYLTDDEQDIIRDAQELSVRVPAYIKLAERRLVALGVKDRTEADKEKERKEEERRIKQQQREAAAAGTPKSSTTRKPPEDPLEYLYDFTKPELLRGYIQILDEMMTNIDDAYSRKLDVRDSIEDLEKFARESIPLLDKLQPRNDNERAAKEEALEKAKQTVTSAKNALNVVPKTEKKRKQ